MNALVAEDARTVTITVQYGQEVRTVRFVASESPWARLQEQKTLASTVQGHLFDMMCEEVSETASAE